MKKILFSVLMLLIAISAFGICNFKDNSIEQKKVLYAKDLTVKSFIKLFKEKYDKNSKLNSVTIAGDFPENWVKPTDVQYLISIMRSKEKCCGYMNIFSSFISSENVEVGGFAIVFLNSYISKTKINMGLNCNPKVDNESIKKIEKWYEQN